MSNSSDSPPAQPASDGAAASHGTSTSKGPLIITGLVVLLLILHQDNWFWDDNTLLLGFIPIGLFWHACISVAASLTWFVATKIAWPIDDSSGPRETGEGQE